MKPRSTAEGVVVSAVRPRTAGATAGLAAGDRILTINGRALVARRAGGPRGAQRCDIAFVGAAEMKRMDEVLDAFAAEGVLSISDLDAFARRG